MKETTINGKTYIPVFHETMLYGDDKCKDCAAKSFSLCLVLPDCFDNKANISCHFKEKTMNQIVEATGLFWWTFEEGLKALKDSKENGYFSEVNRNNGFIAYETLIKGEPEDSEYPHLCWAVTNKYDPRIVAARKG